MLFKPTQPLHKAQRRLRLTTKQASVGGGYYKGNRVGSMGWHTKHGNYIIDLRKVRTYKAPQEPCKLTPFITRDLKVPKGPEDILKDLQKKGLWKGGDAKITEGEPRYIGHVDGPWYLKLWKDIARGDPDRRADFGSQYMVLPGDKPDWETRNQLEEELQRKNKKS